MVSERCQSCTGPCLAPDCSPRGTAPISLQRLSGALMVGPCAVQVDGEHPRLVHLAAAVVGPPHPGLLRAAGRRRGRGPAGPHLGGDRPLGGGARRAGGPGAGAAALPRPQVHAPAGGSQLLPCAVPPGTPTPAVELVCMQESTAVHAVLGSVWWCCWLDDHHRQVIYACVQ